MSAALSHCITCNEWRTGSCGWLDCELSAPASAVSIVPHDSLDTPTLAAPSSGTPHNLSHGDPA